MDQKLNNRDIRIKKLYQESLHRILILDGAIDAEKLAICPGDLILFRGRNSMHRVTPTLGDRTRILVVLAYNSEPGISLSESARMTFFGRID